MSRLKRIDVWEVTISLVKPTAFSEHRFLFAEVPTLDDFLNVCKQLPWTAVWDCGLLQALKDDREKWPLVQPMHKAAHASLLGYNIQVCREQVWQN